MGLRIRHSLKLFQNKVLNNQPSGRHCLERNGVLIIRDSECSLPVRPRVTLPDLLVFLGFSALLSNPSSPVSASAVALTTSFPPLWSINKIPTCLTPHQPVPLATCSGPESMVFSTSYYLLRILDLLDTILS